MCYSAILVLIQLKDEPSSSCAKLCLYNLRKKRAGMMVKKSMVRSNLNYGTRAKTQNLKARLEFILVLTVCMPQWNFRLKLSYVDWICVFKLRTWSVCYPSIPVYKKKKAFVKSRLKDCSVHGHQKPHCSQRNENHACEQVEGRVWIHSLSHGSYTVQPLEFTVIWKQLFP